MPRLTHADLSPCPFCGGPATMLQVGTGRQSCIVGCDDCGCRLETSETFCSGSAWNSRAEIDEIRLALRLPADAPWTDVLARARHLAEVDADDPLRTRDEEVVGV